MGVTLTYLSLIVLIPLSTIVLKTISAGPGKVWSSITSTRALYAYGLSFGASFIAAIVDTFFGVLVAWVLVRYRFPGRKLVDALVDLPFAIPTAVSGLALATLYDERGWLGRYLVKLGIHGASSRLGVVIALSFVSLPFVIRTVQPVLEELPSDAEEVAATLGAGRVRILLGVILPAIIPATLTGFALAFGRAIGEYGSIVFISGNKLKETEIAPFLIVEELAQFDYAGATAIALVLLVVSFVMLLGINRLQAWSRVKTGLA